MTDHATLLYPESFCWPPPAGTRFLKVAKSPAAPPTAFAYAVTEGGLEELPGVEPPPPQQHQHQQHQQQQQRGGVLGMHIANEMDYEAPPPLQRLSAAEAARAVREAEKARLARARHLALTL